jgi:hypothetical protein
MPRTNPRATLPNKWSQGSKKRTFAVRFFVGLLIATTAPSPRNFALPLERQIVAGIEDKMSLTKQAFVVILQIETHSQSYRCLAFCFNIALHG